MSPKEEHHLTFADYVALCGVLCIMALVLIFAPPRSTMKPRVIAACPIAHQ